MVSENTKFNRLVEWRMATILAERKVSGSPLSIPDIINVQVAIIILSRVPGVGEVAITPPVIPQNG